MKQLNFDSLTHIKTPEEWLEKAAAIPQTEAKRQAIFVPRRFVAAASVVLVGVLGLLTFFLHKNTDGLLMIPDGHPTETQASTDGVKVIGSTENVTVSGTEALASTIGQEASTGTQEQRATEPTAAPNDGETAAATQPTQAVTRPTEATASTVQPTSQPVTQGPAAPTEGPRPTQAPLPTVPMTEPPKPTVPPATQQPTEISPAADDVVSVSALFPSSLITDGEPIYCIVQQRGYAGGAVNDRFADYRRAHYMIMKNGMVFAGYDAEVKRPDTQEAVIYDYFFYNARGELLARDSTTVYAVQ